ncbi:MAG: metallophosphoesterase [Kiritimatiellales bacterium]|nr:metallophosphoesterase [Kiritimatiellales bacterium]
MASKIMRRTLIKNSVFAVGAASLGITEITYAAQKKFCRWALLSDTHVPADKTENVRGFPIIENLEAAVSQIVGSKLDGVAITGDLARLEGRAEDYAVLGEYVAKLSKTAPVSLVLGNHDHFKNFNAAFNAFPGEKAPVKRKHVMIVNASPMRLILLDSLQITNHTPGLLGYAQRIWLDSYLKSTPETPTLILLHHTFGEKDSNLLDDERFFRIIVPHRQVKAVIFGHSHAYSFTKHADIDLINLPSTAYNFDKQQPLGWVDASFTAHGGAFKLNAVGGCTEQDGSITELQWRI